MIVRKRRYRCYFCGRDIAQAGFDPCELILVTRITEPDAEQQDAAVHCHANCLAQAAAPDSAFAIPGFPKREDRSVSTA